MNIADKEKVASANNVTIAENEQKVYEAGQMSIIKTKAYGSGNNITLKECLDEPINSLSIVADGASSIKVVFASESGETQTVEHTSTAGINEIVYDGNKVILYESTGEIDITNDILGKQIKALRTYKGLTYVTGASSVGYYQDVRQARYEEGEKDGKASESAKIDYNFKRSKKAVLMRGGEIDMNAEIDELPDAILNIPIDASVGFYEDSEIAYQKIVPKGAEEYALLKELGGMTYRDDVTNTLRDSKVTKIVSHGKNLLSNDDVLNIGKWTKTSTSNWYAYNLDLPDGWYCISAELGEYNTDMYFYLAKSINGGNSYTSAKSVYNGDGKNVDGHIVTDKGCYAPFWFKVDKKAGIVYRLNYNAATENPEILQTRLKQIEHIQIEAVELEQEPSTSYKPSEKAPPTKYTEYRKPITHRIPEAVQDLEGYGMGAIHDTTTYTNMVDLSKKQYTQCVEKLVLNGNDVKAEFGDNTTTGKWRYYVYTPHVLSKVLMSANFDGSITATQTFLILEPNDQENLNNAANFNKWLKDMYNNGTPVEVVYAIQTPIVSDISNKLTDFDNFLSVEGGGTLEFVNEHENAVPSTVKYTTKVGN